MGQRACNWHPVPIRYAALWRFFSIMCNAAFGADRRGLRIAGSLWGHNQPFGIGAGGRYWCRGPPTCSERFEQTVQILKFLLRAGSV
ncbi:hypothetical protein GCM10022398_10360 [Acetobacter lovaniensis]|uniref:Uncharacterized protein n=1 Tax=Acetobacter lovaniensis TaxID=104100 RepID=A0A841QBW0_9PROT|nr:hypothetical protein [Acetobacter lovaniensis]GBQ67715.1 hypothetical protein AA0474_1465 [Acetobacter lovaniensis NRIC 0474]